MRYMPVEGDGNCQFAAIARARGAGNASTVRAQAAEYIATNPEFYKEARKHSLSLRRIEHDGEWGDYYTLGAAGWATQTCIWILHKKRMVRATKPDGAKQTIIVAYDSQHYDAVLAPLHMMDWLGKTEATVVQMEDLLKVALGTRNKKATAPGQTSTLQQRGNLPGPERRGVLTTGTGASQGRHTPYEKAGNRTLKVLSSEGEQTGSTKKPPTQVFHLATANVASLRNRLESVMQLDVDVICLQETALTAAGQKEVAHAMKSATEKNKKRKYRPMWADPQQGRIKEGLISIDIARRGGLATFVREPRTALGTSLERDDAKQDINSRWQHTRVSIDGENMWLHIITVYCPAGEGEEPRRQRERLLQHVLRKKAMELGNVPVIVAGDLNTDEKRSYELRHALMNGWTDAAGACAAGKGEDPMPTFTRKNCASRIDYILLNAFAAQALQGCRTSRDVKGADHMTLTVELRLARFQQTVKRYMIPREIPGGVEPAEEEGSKALQESNFREHMRKDPEAAYLALAEASEKILLGDETVGTAPYRGRGKVRQPQQRQLCAPTTTGSCGAASIMQVRLEKMRGRLRAIQTQLNMLQKRGGGQLSKVTVNTIHNLNGELEHTRVKCLPIDPTQANIEDMVADAEIMSEAVERREREMVKEQRTARHRSYLDSVEQGKETKELVDSAKGIEDKRGTATVEMEKDTIANPQELDRTMREHWEHVFAKYRDKPQPAYATFEKEYGAYIEKRDMVWTPITGIRLKQVLKKKTARSAAGVDGWRMAELRRLPVSILDAWAVFLNEVEETGKWPESALTALVTLIPKTKNAGPLEHRPITVTSAVYRLWACTRLGDILEWQESWIHKTQHGFRARHGTEDVLMDICTRIEEAAMDKTPLLGVALDFAKCFDTVPQQLVLKLMERMGMDKGILRALEGMYKGLRRRFRYATGVGEEFTTTNGILQGCPISIIMINALLAVLMRSVEERTGAETLSYADDAYLLAKLAEVLQKATDSASAFCDIVGMELNTKKSEVFAAGAKAPGIEVAGRQLRSTNKIKILGARIRTDGQTQTDNTRARAAGDTLRRLATTQLSFWQKAEVLRTTVLPSCLYDVAFAPPSEGYLKSLTSTATYALWGPRYRTRSPAAVLSNLFSGHTHDPEVAAPYRALAAIYRTRRKLGEVWERCQRLAKGYQDPTRTTPLGPIGNAMKRWLPKISTNWGQFTEMLAENKDKFAHVVREKLRSGRAEHIQDRRRSMEGLDRGADPRTNDLWRELMRLGPQGAMAARDLRRIVAGGVFYTHPKAWYQDKITRRVPPPEGEQSESEDSSEEEGDETHERVNKRPTTDEVTCDACGAEEDESNMLRHALWECSVAKEVQQKEVHAEVVANKTEMPICMQLHGTLPRGHRTHQHRLRKTQYYLLEVVAKRDQLLQDKRKLETYTTHPWNR
eukprot:TRINITY_DN274_c0_g1_i12.p1 TRINITY_DN274_c0_g1~~TRINITY_DN274_c0_g1_i12.p1  ORF type:complete len:1432 (+),score=270.25 TRINITY_DN274_c0_g1_i12:1996-6291(+)